MVGHCLNNETTNRCLASAVDSEEYVARANSLLNYGFYNTFADAYRMPGYPMYIAMFQYLFGENSLFAVRASQVILTCISLLIIQETLKHYVSKSKALLISLVFSLFPFWYFSTLILAESLTLFVTTIIACSLSRILTEHRLRVPQVIMLGTLVATSTYLKPNNVILYIPIMLILRPLNKSRFLGNIAIFSITTLILLMPWLIFVNKQVERIPTLATTSGINLYTGTGMRTAYDDGVLAKAAVFWRVDPKQNVNDIVTPKTDLESRELNNLYTERAIEIWKERPLNLIGFGLTKILIAYSLWTDNFMEMILGFPLLIIIISAFHRSWKHISISNNAGFEKILSYVALTLAGQAFFFQADRRFVFVVILPFIAIQVGNLLRQKVSK